MSEFIHDVAWCLKMKSGAVKKGMRSIDAETILAWLI
jgi:hypothetical protein